MTPREQNPSVPETSQGSAMVSAAEVDRRRNEFLAQLAHELRNPLAPMRNAVQVLNHPGADQGMRARALQMIDRQVGNVSRMADDLLDVSRMGQGKIILQKESIDLGAVLRRAIRQVQHHSEPREQQIIASIPETPVLVEGDPVRLERVFDHLLNNASKFTSDHGHIWVSLEEEGDAAADGGEHAGSVVVRVRDDGLGISPELLPHVFNVFEQNDLQPKSYSGLGIGLTLVQNLVRQHGGGIEASSGGVGHGSEFIVHLPKSMAGEVKASSGSGDSLQTEQGAPASRKILVVDDNADAADSLAILLRMAGYQVEIAYDGMETLKVASTFRPDVILLDIGLPGMDGYDVARELHNMPESKECILVAVTGYGRDDDRKRAMDAGFHFHLTKPVNHESLKALLDHPAA